MFPLHETDCYSELHFVPLILYFSTRKLGHTRLKLPHIKAFFSYINFYTESLPCLQLTLLQHNSYYEGHLESKERFAIKKYLLIIGKKKNMKVLSHTFTYFFT